MRILGFQTDLSLLSRYLPFIQMIARNVEEFHLCYLRGELEEESIIFHHPKNTKSKIIQKSTILVAFPAALKSFKICRKYGTNLIYAHARIEKAAYADKKKSSKHSLLGQVLKIVHVQ